MLAAGPRDRRHARHGRSRRRPRRRHARVPAVRRRPGARVRRLAGAVAPPRSTSSARRRSCARRCCSCRPRSTSTRSGSASSSSTAATSSAAGVALPIVAVSSHLRTRGARPARTAELNEAQPLPRADHRPRQRGGRAGEGQRAAARSDARRPGVVAPGPHRPRRGAPSCSTTPPPSQRRSPTSSDAKERLEHLRGPAPGGPRRRRPRHRPDQRGRPTFRGAIRTISRTMDEQIEVLTNGDAVGRDGPRPADRSSPTR